MFMNEFVGAGVLPWSINDEGKIVLLLGQEEKGNFKGAGTWCGFGGSRNEGENEVQTAAREFMEESMALIMNESEILNILEDPNNIQHTWSHQGARFIDFLVYIPYNEQLIDLFSRVRNIMLIHNTTAEDNCLLEKTNIAWFDIHYVYKAAQKHGHVIRSEFANFLVNNYETIVEKCSQIKSN